MLNWKPVSKAQAGALASPAQFLLYGGAAGGGKSEFLLMDAAQDIDNPAHQAILFRETFPELEKSLILRSHDLYKPMGGVYNEQKHRWTFPSGAMIHFGHAQRDSEIHQYQSAQFNYIGFDEASHFSEFRIRYMFSRLRSPDKDLHRRRKIRLATNPGGEGHTSLMHIFMGPTCIHCMPSPQSRAAFKIYDDATWFSDKEPVTLTTCFIPAKVSDHNIFGEGGIDYLPQLKSLPAKFRKALMDGCWAEFEGQYFRCWDMNKMIVPSDCLFKQGTDEHGFPVYYDHNDKRGEPVREPQSWWPHWVAVDWGFGHHTVAYLLCKAPNGTIYALQEFYINKTAPPDLALKLKRMWYHEDRDSPRIGVSYLSPDAWAKRTDENPIADQMAGAADIYFTPASNDRIGGAMMIYNLLDSGKLKITSACAELGAALPSRIHDDNRKEDVQKTDDLADDCYDAFRYGVYSHVGNVEKPREVKIREYVKSDDPTTAMLQRAIAEHKYSRDDEPVSYMTGRR